ncbi:MurR/RpiR family transcriptional regulator [Agrobacterium tumefaciens]|jgi:DNA-binding MurR/RpiR family transcriptional regulator|uniref:RpiR family transcriptional regulator n=1 Tax=Agrobacterium genomosp. 13 str. CFBP 6927 TaxID=1183428 RepID=A0ABP2BJ26_9HYPH|nr:MULTISPECIES: MurR/RpiR family transcriptional regulator [Agrobacterium tumefaciens complex]TQN58776.1 MurR/RpiR family transcriptional regulator [Agrobacterium tumefaciens]UXS32650.1 MurR/RpiR family transcriptional regulator [Agrobacterium tumefaciens]WKL19532.1 MurR/RpiR family transcriptional regulator [Agrobacterium tumefaciens]CDN93044.1 Transcriptional regulator, RpiR family protein [Agrobacterium tumefaciens]CUX36892.1 RpiR family transcriptional regulator [Agrobacterium genomosp. 1
MDIFARIQEDKGQFSQSERRIAEILVSDFEFAVNASIIELAARAEVSPPTVTRFCRRLGCQSFSDFKVSLAKTAYVGIRYLTSEPTSTGPSDVAEEVLAKAQEALFLLHKTLDPALAGEAAIKIANSGMIYAFGAGGNSSMIASEIQNRLFRLGLRVSTSADHSMQLMMTAAARKEDVIIGSSFSGRNMELVKCFRLAREMGVATIALTQSDTPVAMAADMVVAVNVPEGNNIFRPTSSRYAYLAAVDILATLAAYHHRQRSMVTLRHIKQQLVEHRDPDDRQLLGD